MKQILYTLLILAFWSCKNTVDEAPKGTPKEAVKGYAEQELATAFVETFLKSTPSTRNALSKALQPTPADVQAVFIDTAIHNLVINYTKRVFEEEKFAIRLFPEYGQVMVWTASVQDFKNNSGDAIEFPSQFLKIIPYLNNDLIVHRFKFVQEGYEAGAAYEGLVYVNGHWVLFPKIWRVLDEF